MAKEIGGYKHYTIDAKEEFANEYIARGIKANAEYEGYPLSTALARPLIAQKLSILPKKKEQQLLHTDVLEKETINSDLKLLF